MTLTRTLEKLERFGDSDADRALRPPVLDPFSPSQPTDSPSRPRGQWRRRLLIGAAVTVVVALLVTWLVAFSPLLGASTVAVRGTASLSVAQIRTAAAVSQGTPLVRLDTTAVARRVEALPQVASATVTVAYPSTVTVTVVERVPVLRLASPTRLVDATGDVYLELPASAAVPDGLPATAATGAELGAVAAVSGALPAAVRAAVVRRIDVTTPAVDGNPPVVSIALDDGRTVIWGDTTRDAEKGALFGTLFGAGAQDVPGSTIDLSSPDQVVTR